LFLQKIASALLILNLLGGVAVVTSWLERVSLDSGRLPIVAASDFFQWRIPEFIYSYGNSTCTFIGPKIHITLKLENSSFLFSSGGCADGTLWLPEDLDTHGIAREVLEFPGPCEFGPAELAGAHAFLSRLCLGDDIEGGQILRDRLSGREPVLSGKSLGDILAFAVSVATEGAPAAETTDLEISFAQGIRHRVSDSGALAYECACVFSQEEISGFFSFQVTNFAGNFFVKDFYLRAMNGKLVLIGPFTFLEIFSSARFQGWKSICAGLAAHMRLDLPSLRDTLMDFAVSASPTGMCDCLLQNMFSMEISSYANSEQDMITLWCSGGRAPRPCEAAAFGAGDFSFAVACGGRRRPGPPEKLAKISEILDSVRV